MRTASRNNNNGESTKPNSRMRMRAAWTPNKRKDKNEAKSASKKEDATNNNTTTTTTTPPPRSYNPTTEELNQGIQSVLAQSPELPGKQIHAVLMQDHVTWNVPERRTLKFVKRQQSPRHPANTSSPYFHTPHTTALPEADDSSIQSSSTYASARSRASTASKRSLRFSPFGKKNNHDNNYDAGSVSSKGSLRRLFSRRKNKSKSKNNMSNNEPLQPGNDALLHSTPAGSLLPTSPMSDHADDRPERLLLFPDDATPQKQTPQPSQEELTAAITTEVSPEITTVVEPRAQPEPAADTTTDEPELETFHDPPATNTAAVVEEPTTTTTTAVEQPVSAPVVLEEEETVETTTEEEKPIAVMEEPTTTDEAKTLVEEEPVALMEEPVTDVVEDTGPTKEEEPPVAVMETATSEPIEPIVVKEEEEPVTPAVLESAKAVMVEPEPVEFHETEVVEPVMTEPSVAAPELEPVVVEQEEPEPVVVDEEEPKPVVPKVEETNTTTKTAVMDGAEQPASTSPILRLDTDEDDAEELFYNETGEFEEEDDEEDEHPYLMGDDATSASVATSLDEEDDNNDKEPERPTIQELDMALASPTPAPAVDDMALASPTPAPVVDESMEEIPDLSVDEGTGFVVGVLERESPVPVEESTAEPTMVIDEIQPVSEEETHNETIVEPKVDETMQQEEPMSTDALENDKNNNSDVQDLDWDVNEEGEIVETTMSIVEDEADDNLEPVVIAEPEIVEPSSDGQAAALDESETGIVLERSLGLFEELQAQEMESHDTGVDQESLATMGRRVSSEVVAAVVAAAEKEQEEEEDLAAPAPQKDATQETELVAEETEHDEELASGLKLFDELHTTQDDTTLGDEDGPLETPVANVQLKAGLQLFDSFHDTGVETTNDEPSVAATDRSVAVVAADPTEVDVYAAIDTVLDQRGHYNGELDKSDHCPKELVVCQGCIIL